MRRVLLSFSFSVGAFLVGVWLPYFPLPNGLRLCNLFWSMVDGLGLWLIDETTGLSVESRTLLFLGVLVWPLVVSVLMFTIGLLLYRVRPRLRMFVVSGLIATAFLNVDVNRVSQPPFSDLPTYHRLFAAVW